MGLAVIYVHVKTNESLLCNLEHAHWDTSTDGACAVSKQLNLRGVTMNLHTTRPHLPHLNLAGLRPVTLRRRKLERNFFVNTGPAALTYGGVVYLR